MSNETTDVIKKYSNLSVDELTKEIAKKELLFSLCKRFINNHKITCPETIYQCDQVRETAYEFLVYICDLIGYYEDKNE